MPKIVKKYGRIALVLGLILAFVATYAFMPLAKAADVSSRSDTLSDSRPTTDSNHYIKFTIGANIDLGDTLIIKFDDAGDLFNLTDVAFGDIDLEDDDEEQTLAGDCTGSDHYGVTVSTVTDEIEFECCAGDGGNMDSGSIVEIEIGTNAASGTNMITNPAAGVYDIDVAGTFGETGTMKVSVLTAISVSATIAESLTFSIDDTSIGMGTMTSSNVYFATADENGDTSEQAGDAPTRLVVSTNAASGVSITMHDVGNGSGSAGIYKSAGTPKLIAAVAANSVSAGSEGYAVYGKDASNLTINSNFDGGSSTGVITTSAAAFASAAGAVSGADVDVQPKAGIAGSTPAGSYADTLIFVATPTF